MAQQGGEAGAPAQAGHGESEAEELARLRAEVRDLHAAQDKAGQGHGHGRWRTALSITLIVLGSILAPVAVLGYWAGNQVSNTDRYVANMEPLISQPPIQNALTSQITTAITNNVNITSYVNQAVTQLRQRGLTRLSGLLQNFSGTLVDGITTGIHNAVATVVASPAMVTVWNHANRAAHTVMVQVLSGNNNGAVKLVNGKVTLSLGPFISQVATTLTARGVRVASLIPKNLNPTFALFNAPDLQKAQTGYRLVNTLRWVLPVLSIVLLGLGIWAARTRRKGLIGAALGMAGGMIVLGIALAIARVIYLRSVPQSVLPSDAAGIAYDTLVRFIRDGLRVLLVLGIVIALGAYLTGPASGAVKIRRGVTAGIGRVRGRGEQAGLHTGSFGIWVGAHKTWLRAGALALVALIFILWSPPSLALVIWMVLILLVLLGLIELLGTAKPASTAAPRPRAGA